MSSKGWRCFSGFTAIVLALAILPSLTALSASYSDAFPALAAKTGPLAPLKLFAPFLFLFVAISISRIIVRERKTNEFRGLAILGAAWLIGTGSTLWAAGRCGFPPMFLREWATISMGLLAGLALRYLPPKRRQEVYAAWLGILSAAIVLDLFAPSTIDWLYNHVFDPATRVGDVAETGTRALTAVFGRQSAAKLMAWLPWLVLPLAGGRFRRWLGAGVIGIGIWSGLILATSQRGPMLACFAALLAFGLHRAWSERKWKPAGVSAAAVVVGLASVFVIVPKTIVEPRLLHRMPVDASGNPLPEAQQLVRTADTNSRFRWEMTRLSMASIASHPLGDACIPKEIFAARGLAETHSHNLFLEQYRSRGWLWGSIHLALWILAAFFFLSGRDLAASAGVAALTAIFICGLVDHPWFVLNQAIVLGAILVEGALGFFAGKREIA